MGNCVEKSQEQRWTLQFHIIIGGLILVLGFLCAAVVAFFMLFDFDVPAEFWSTLCMVAFLFAVVMALPARFFARWVQNSREFHEMAGKIDSMENSLGDERARATGELERLKYLVAKAEEENRQKSEFFAGLSHELRTPLNAIVNIPGSLLRDFETIDAWLCKSCDASFHKDPESSSEQELCPECNKALDSGETVVLSGDASEHQYYLGRIQYQGAFLLDLVNKILDFSRLEAGKAVVTIEDVHVSVVVDEVVRTLSGLAEVAGLKLSSKIHETDLTMEVDSAKLSQILINLIGNAIKFTQEGGIVSVGYEPYNDNGTDSILFTVTDTGVGIPTEELESIFESYMQIGGEQTRSKGGTGLGLAICKQLVGLHDGRIWATSEVGIGTTFSVVLPRVNTSKFVRDEEESREEHRLRPA